MELIIGAGLFLTGLILNKNKNDKNEINKSDVSNTIDKKYNYVNSLAKNYYDNYKINIFVDSNEFLYENISNLYKKSIVPDSKIVNNVYRIVNNPI